MAAAVEPGGRPTARRRRSWWVVAATTLLAVWLAYGGALDAAFVSDDRPLIADNFRLDRPGAWQGFFTAGAWANSALEAQGGKVYRPLFLTWIWAVAGVAGKSAPAFHAANVVLHSLNALLALALIARVLPGAGPWQAGLGAGVFALHPVMSECVAWVSGGTDALMSVLVFGCVLAWLRYRESGRTAFACAAAALYALALLTKETAILVPVLIVALDRLGARRPIPQRPAESLQPGWRRRLRSFWQGAPVGWYLVLALTAVLYLALRAWALHVPGKASAFVFDAAHWLRLGEYLLLAVRYVFVPWPQHLALTHPAAGLASVPDLVAGSAGLVALAVLCRRLPMGGFAGLWFAAALLPPLGLAFHEPGTFALRFLYLPMFAVALWVAAAAAAVPAGAAPARVWRVAVPAGAVLLALLAVTRIAVAQWHDEERVLRRILAADPGNVSIYRSLAEHHERAGATERALAVYEAGLQVSTRPGDRAAMLDGLGYSYGHLGRHTQSIAAYRRLLQHPGREADAFVGMGNNFWVTGRLDEAAEAYRKAIAVNPGHFDALSNLARLSELQRQRAEARRRRAQVDAGRERDLRRRAAEGAARDRLPP